MPGTRQPPPPETADSAAPEGIAAVVGTGAGAAASLTPAAVGAVAVKLSADAIRKATAKIIAAFIAFARKREDAMFELLPTQIARQFPERTKAEIDPLIEEERRREAEFRRKMQKRLQRDLPKALASDDPAVRAESVTKVLDRERRYVTMREESIRERAYTRMEMIDLERVSPQGAYWRLSPFVSEHTVGCLAMGNKFWPWPVLHRIHPQLHAGCACHLFSLEDAVARGYMTPDQVPDPKDAARRAATIAREIHDVYESVSEDEIRAFQEELECGLWEATCAALLDEGRWDERYDSGEKGGQFKPKRGGISVRRTIRGKSRALLRKVVPAIPRTPVEATHAREGEWVWLRGNFTFIPRATEYKRRIDGIDFVSPAGSNNIYRDGYLVHVPGQRPPHHNDLDRPRAADLRKIPDTAKYREALPEGARDEIAKLSEDTWNADFERISGRVTGALSHMGDNTSPARVGDDTATLTAALKAQGFEPIRIESINRPDTERGVAALVQFQHPQSGASITVISDKGKVLDHFWETPTLDEMPEGMPDGLTSMSDFKRALRAFANETAGRRGGTRAYLSNIDYDSRLDDHRGGYTTEDGGSIRLGIDGEHALERYFAARAEGQPLSPFEAGDLWAGIHAGVHEALHAGAPIAWGDYAYPDLKAWEESLNEEWTQIETANLCRRLGVTEALRFQADFPDTAYARGAYGYYRQTLDSWLNAMKVAPEERERVIAELRFDVPPSARSAWVAERVLAVASPEWYPQYSDHPSWEGPDYVAPSREDRIAEIEATVTRSFERADERQDDSRFDPILRGEVGAGSDVAINGVPLRVGGRITAWDGTLDADGEPVGVPATIRRIHPGKGGDDPDFIVEADSEKPGVLLPGLIPRDILHVEGAPTTVTINGHAYKVGDAVRYDGRADGGFSEAVIERIERNDPNRWLIHGRTTGDSLVPNQIVLLTPERVGRAALDGPPSIEPGSAREPQTAAMLAMEPVKADEPPRRRIDLPDALRAAGLPEDLKLADYQAAQILTSGRHEVAAFPAEPEYGQPSWEMTFKPVIPSRFSEVVLPRDQDKLDAGGAKAVAAPTYFDPSLARIENADSTDMYGPTATRVALRDSAGVRFLDDLAQPEEGFMYRGMSAPEYEQIQRVGFIESKGDYNIGPDQRGLTYYTTIPGTAAQYAHSYASPQYKATPLQPAYVVKVRRPDDVAVEHVPGVGDDEIGVRGSISADQIVEVYQGRVWQAQAGAYRLLAQDFNPDSGYRLGSGVGGDTEVVWRSLPVDTAAEDVPKDGARRGHPTYTFRVSPGLANELQALEVDTDDGSNADRSHFVEQFTSAERRGDGSRDLVLDLQGVKYLERALYYHDDIWADNADVGERGEAARNRAFRRAGQTLRQKTRRVLDAQEIRTEGVPTERTSDDRAELARIIDGTHERVHLGNTGDIANAYARGWSDREILQVAREFGGALDDYETLLDDPAFQRVLRWSGDTGLAEIARSGWHRDESNTRLPKRIGMTLLGDENTERDGWGVTNTGASSARTDTRRPGVRTADSALDDFWAWAADPRYTAIHEAHHMHGSNSEFDLGSSVAFAWHAQKRGLTGPGPESIKREIGYALMHGTGPNSRRSRALRALFGDDTLDGWAQIAGYPDAFGRRPVVTPNEYNGIEGRARWISQMDATYEEKVAALRSKRMEDVSDMPYFTDDLAPGERAFMRPNGETLVLQPSGEARVLVSVEQEVEKHLAGVETEGVADDAPLTRRQMQVLDLIPPPEGRTYTGAGIPDGFRSGLEPSEIAAMLGDGMTGRGAQQVIYALVDRGLVQRDDFGYQRRGESDIGKLDAGPETMRSDDAPPTVGNWLSATRPVPEFVDPVPGAEVGIRLHRGGDGVSETIRSQMYGRDTGHFGTGVYFASDADHVAALADEGSRVGVPLDGKRLYRPLSQDDAFRLHGGLRVLNRLVNTDTSEEWSALWAGQRLSLFSIGLDLPSRTADGRFVDTDEKEALIRQAVDATRADALRGYTDRDYASTRFMKALGYDGVDVRGLGDEIDNTQFGSVLYRDDLFDPESIPVEREAAQSEPYHEPRARITFSDVEALATASTPDKRGAVVFRGEAIPNLTYTPKLKREVTALGFAEKGEWWVGDKFFALDGNARMNVIAREFGTQLSQAFEDAPWWTRDVPLIYGEAFYPDVPDREWELLDANREVIRAAIASGFPVAPEVEKRMRGERTATPEPTPVAVDEPGLPPAPVEEDADEFQSILASLRGAKNANFVHQALTDDLRIPGLPKLGFVVTDYTREGEGDERTRRAVYRNFNTGQTVVAISNPANELLSLEGHQGNIDLPKKPTPGSVEAVARSIMGTPYVNAQEVLRGQDFHSTGESIERTGWFRWTHPDGRSLVVKPSSRAGSAKVKTAYPDPATDEEIGAAYAMRAQGDSFGGYRVGMNFLDHHGITQDFDDGWHTTGSGRVADGTVYDYEHKADPTRLPVRVLVHTDNMVAAVGRPDPDDPSVILSDDEYGKRIDEKLNAMSAVEAFATTLVGRNQTTLYQVPDFQDYGHGAFSRVSGNGRSEPTVFIDHGRGRKLVLDFEDGTVVRATGVDFSYPSGTEVSGGTLMRDKIADDLRASVGKLSYEQVRDLLPDWHPSSSTEGGSWHRFVNQETGESILGNFDLEGTGPGWNLQKLSAVYATDDTPAKLKGEAVAMFLRADPFGRIGIGDSEARVGALGATTQTAWRRTDPDIANFTGLINGETHMFRVRFEDGKVAEFGLAAPLPSPASPDQIAALKRTILPSLDAYAEAADSLVAAKREATEQAARSKAERSALLKSRIAEGKSPVEVGAPANDTIQQLRDDLDFTIQSRTSVRYSKKEWPAQWRKEHPDADFIPSTPGKRGISYVLRNPDGHTLRIVSDRSVPVGATFIGLPVQAGQGFISKVVWEPAPKVGRDAITGRLPATVEEMIADGLARVDELGKRYGEKTDVPTIKHTSGKNDHSAHHEWNGTIVLGKGCWPSMKDAAKAEKDGVPLTSEQAGEAYSAYQTLQHEINHGVNPLRSGEYGKLTPQVAMEEFLTEETSHVLTLEWMKSKGDYGEQIRSWVKGNPRDTRVLGTYRAYRVKGRKALTEAGIPEEDWPEVMFRMKFHMTQPQRFEYLGNLIAGRQGIPPEEGERRVKTILYPSQSRSLRPTPETSGEGFQRMLDLEPGLEGVEAMAREIRLPNGTAEVGTYVVVPGQIARPVRGIDPGGGRVLVYDPEAAEDRWFISTRTLIAPVALNPWRRNENVPPDLVDLGDRVVRGRNGERGIVTELLPVRGANTMYRVAWDGDSREFTVPHGDLYRRADAPITDAEQEGPGLGEPVLIDGEMIYPGDELVGKSSALTDDVESPFKVLFAEQDRQVGELTLGGVRRNRDGVDELRWFPVSGVRRPTETRVAA